MSPRRAIVIAVDGLRASALGSYGNSDFETPAFDRLASQSLVVEFLWNRAPSLEGFYGDVWPPALRDAIAAGGTLVTDERQVAGAAEACGFPEVQFLEVTGAEAAPTIADTTAAQLFAVAIDQLSGWAEPAPSVGMSEAPRLLWLHARGFQGIWDAPYELRQQLLDEDDPAAATFVTPPEEDAVQNHDAALLHRTAYAAQAMVLDECLGALLSAIEELQLDDVLLVVVGCRGYALGEHGATGQRSLRLYSEVLHVPCLVRRGKSEAPPPRASRLALTADLGPMLASWLAGDDAESGNRTAHWMLAEGAESASGPSLIAAIDGEELAVRTHSWMLRKAGSGAPELFVKPDDRWEANEVSALCGDVAERLLAAAGSAVDGQYAGPLDDDLA
jgi:hypothetical protein